MERIEIILSLVISVGTILMAIYKVLRRMDKVSMRLEQLTERTNQLDTRLDKMEGRLDKIESRLVRVEARTERLPAIEFKIDNLPYIEEKVREHSTDIASLRSDFYKSPNHSEGLRTAQKQSPKTLTKLGQEIYEGIKGAEFLSKNRGALLSYIEDRRPLTAYDVQSIAFRAVAFLVDTPAFNDVKHWLYHAKEVQAEDGTYTELTLFHTCEVLSIPLRDMYLEAHPEIPQ